MEAGRDLDKLVVEKVFGYPVVVGKSPTNREDFYYIKDNSRFPVPAYSTHIFCAWDIINHFDAFEIKSKDKKVYCSLSDYKNDSWGEAIGTTAPHAICLAALELFEI